MQAILKSKWSWAGLAFSLAILVVGVFFRPLWRDEFWALHYSGAGMSLLDAITQRMTNDVHPPFYFILLHLWRLVSDAPIWARAFNLLVLVIGVAGIWALGKQRRTETLLFLLLSLTSYWVVFYTIELRMYLMLFLLGAMSVLIVRNALEEPEKQITHVALFALVGMAASATQFFGTLWIAMLGFWVGIAFLHQRKFGAFVLWGLASAIAIAPAAAWIFLADPANNHGSAGPATSDPRGIMHGFDVAFVQFLRGLVIKTFGSNLAATAILFVTGAALLRRKARIVIVLLLACVSMFVVCTLLHVFYTQFIKERGFAAMMPAVIFLMVRAIDYASEQGKAQRLLKWTPIVILISPLLFMGEYGKDRENWGGVRELLAESGDCAGAEIIVYNRRSPNAAEFHREITAYVLDDVAAGKRDVVIRDVDDMIARGETAHPKPGCRVHAAAIAMPKADSPLHQTARERFRQVGVQVEELEERQFGKGRQIVLVERSTASEP
ncbi:MAG: hypothetical protein ABW199_01265 [Caulobacterales bacterium]